jgi:type I restriction enzyme, S subunit
MNRFSSVKFGDVATFKYGKMPEKEKIVSTGGYPIFTGYRVAGYYQDCMYDEPQLVVVARGVGGTGNVVISPPKSYITNISIVAELDVKRCSREYLKYYFALNNLRYLDSGSAQSQITILDLKNLTIELPTNTEQRAIVALLGAMDDKIELNSRMNATLEAAARALFKSWFVDFDPVKAKMAGNQPFGMDAAAALFPARLTESELGDIPEGWQPKEIGNLVKVTGGGTPSTTNPDFWADAGHYWATPKDLSNLNSPVLLKTERQISAAGLGAISSGLLPEGTVLMSSRAPIGYIAIAEVPIAINQGFIALICSDALPNLFVWLWLHQNMDAIKGRANGSTFQEISKSNFRPLPVVLPSPKVLAAFTEITSPLWNKIVSNHKENERLIKGRDYLLPKLISGEIRIPDAEKFVKGLV